MVDYTIEERKLLNFCIPYFRKEIMPDTPIADIPVIDAMEFCHQIGRFVKGKRSHQLMNSIFEKNGMEVESNEKRQLRLAAGRKERIFAKRQGAIDELEVQKEKELAEIRARKALLSEKILAGKQAIMTVSDREERAIKLAKEANERTKKAEEELSAIKKEMAKAKTNRENNKKKLKDAAAELAKGEKASVVKEPPADVTPKEPPTEIVEPEVPKEEKSIDELIEDLGK